MKHLRYDVWVLKVCFNIDYNKHYCNLMYSTPNSFSSLKFRYSIYYWLYNENSEWIINSLILHVLYSSSRHWDIMNSILPLNIWDTLLRHAFGYLLNIPILCDQFIKNHSWF